MGNTQQQKKSGKSNRGFASMDKALQREIASKGGRAAHAKGVAHEYTSEEARLAGRKGGKTTGKNREHMARIGRRGGEARARNIGKPRAFAAPYGGPQLVKDVPGQEHFGVEDGAPPTPVEGHFGENATRAAHGEVGA